MFVEEIFIIYLSLFPAYHIKKGLRKQPERKAPTQLKSTLLIKERGENREKQQCIRYKGILQKNVMENPGAERLYSRRNSPVYASSDSDKSNWSEKKREVMIISLKQTRDMEARKWHK